MHIVNDVGCVLLEEKFDSAEVTSGGSSDATKTRMGELMEKHSMITKDSVDKSNSHVYVLVYSICIIIYQY